MIDLETTTEPAWFAWISSMSRGYPVIILDHLPNLDKPTYLRAPLPLTIEDRRRVADRLRSEKEYNGRTLSPLDVLSELYPCSGEGAMGHERTINEPKPPSLEDAILAAIDRRFPGGSQRRVVTIDAVAVATVTTDTGSAGDAGRSGGTG